MELPLDQPGVQPITDFLGRHPVRPKEEIGQALAQLGFSIPRIFESVDDAISSGSDFVARSEGPDELYHSGLKASISTRARGYNEDELRDYAARLSDPERSFRSLTLNKPLGACGIIAAERWHWYVRRSFGNNSSPSNELAASHGLSYWQHVAGDNFYMTGDNANPEKYYIGRTTEGRGSFTIVEGDSITSHYVAPRRNTTGDEHPDIKKLIEFYTNVRQAPLFDPQNVPILEFSDPGKRQEVKFLQYFPGQPAVSELPTITTSQSEVLFVRGATPKEGITTYMETDADSATEAIYAGNYPIVLGRASPFETAWNEYLFPRIDTLLLHPIADFSTDVFASAMGLNAIDHGGRSQLHKPKLTLTLSKLAMDFLARRQSERNEPIPLHITADGARAEVYAQIGEREVELHRLRDRLHERGGF